MAKIGISGTGFIGTGLAYELQRCPDIELVSVLTRRNPAQVSHPFPGKLTCSLETFLAGLDLVVECSGDVLHATTVVEAAFAHGLPVVTMNAEFHVTVGSSFVGAGRLTEAEGDQPGCLAALHERVVSMGFEPVLYGNIKGFLNHHPTSEQMAFWANKQGIRLDQVTAFTDGTKIQIEQALVANGLGAGLLQPGMCGPHANALEPVARQLAEQVLQHGTLSGGHTAVEYVLNPGGPAGVFIVARHEREQQAFLRYLKLGDGPLYFLLQPFHLCHLEVPATIRRVLNGGGPLLTNSAAPAVGVCAIAKQALQPGAYIEKGIGSFQVRGEAVPFADHVRYVPIGLLQQAHITRPVAAGSRIEWQDVRLPESSALTRFRRLL